MNNVLIKLRRLIGFVKEFTIVEYLIVIAILGIITATIIPSVKNNRSGVTNQPFHIGIQCVSGYKFYRDRQIVDNNGSGIPC